MIRINLLPFRAARKKETIRRQLAAFVLSIVVVTVVLYLVGGVWTRKVDRLNTDIKQLNTALSKERAAAKEVDRINKELAALEKKTEVILSLKETRRAPVEMLDAMTSLVVEKRMWFTSFTDKNKTVKIKGVALDNKTVADFMTRLEQSGLFSTVNLDGAKQQIYQKTLSLKSFEITCSKAVESDKDSNDKAAS